MTDPNPLSEERVARAKLWAESIGYSIPFHAKHITPNRECLEDADTVIALIAENAELRALLREALAALIEADAQYPVQRKIDRHLRGTP
jgi:hypothetical protein